MDEKIYKYCLHIDVFVYFASVCLEGVQIYRIIYWNGHGISNNFQKISDRNEAPLFWKVLQK